MPIFLTGDMHGNVQQRLNTKNFPEQRELDPNAQNYVIVLGDFGIIWDVKPSKQESYLLGWLDEKPFYTLFIDGNHENHERLAQFPEVDFLGGKAHKISDKVYHLMRGEMYEICGYSFFCFGGAASHDAEVLLDPENDVNWKRKRKRLRKQFKNFRVVGKTWWAGEQASDAEKKHGIEVLDEYGWKCDFVLTHTPPESVLKVHLGNDVVADATSKYLEEIRQKLDFEHWFFGHLHNEENVTDKMHLLFRQLFLLSSRG